MPPAFAWRYAGSRLSASIKCAGSWELRRAEAAGCHALVFTVDGPVVGNREWDRRNYRAPGKLDLRNRIDVLAHPGWLWRVYRHGLPPFANLAPLVPGGGGPLATQRWLQARQDASLPEPKDGSK